MSYDNRRLVLSPFRHLAFLGAIIFAGCSVVVSPSDTEVESMNSRDAKDLRQIVQLIIDHPALQQYYHEEIAGRQPLYILKTPPFAGEPELTKFGAPVRYKDRDQLTGDDYEAYAEFPEINIGGDSAHVIFTYAVEGVYATSSLRKVGDEWRIEYFRIAER